MAIACAAGFAVFVFLVGKKIWSNAVLRFTCKFTAAFMTVVSSIAAAHAIQDITLENPDYYVRGILFFTIPAALAYWSVLICLVLSAVVLLVQGWTVLRAFWMWLRDNIQDLRGGTDEEKSARERRRSWAWVLNMMRMIGAMAWLFLSFEITSRILAYEVKPHLETVLVLTEYSASHRCLGLPANSKIHYLDGDRISVAILNKKTSRYEFSSTACKRDE